MTKRKTTILYVMCFVSYLLTYTVRLNISLAAPGLRTAGVLTNEQIGILGGVFSAVYSIGRIINGSLSDRVRPRNMIAIGFCVAGLSNIVISSLPPFAAILLLWIVNGYALSMIWGSFLSVCYSMYSGEEARKKTSFLSTAVAVGNIAAIVLTSWLVSNVSVAAAFFVPGIMIMTVGIIDLFLYKDIGLYSDKNKAGSKTPERSGLAKIGKLMKMGSVRRMAVSAFCHGVMKDCIGVYMALIFVDVYGLNMDAGVFMILIPIFGIIGRTLFVPIYQKNNGDELKTSKLGFIVCALGSLLLCFKSLGMVTALVSIALIYGSVSLINVAFLAVYPSRFIKSQSLNTVAGCLDVCTYAGSAIFSVIYGFTVEKWGYLPMFISWMVLGIIGLIVLPKSGDMEEAEA